MSKQLTTPWYISAWIVAAIAWLAGVVAYAIAGPEDSTIGVIRPPISSGGVIGSFYATDQNNRFALWVEQG